MYRIFFVFSILTLLFSCSDELPNPVTIKGMKLGLNFNEQKKIGEQNEICEDLESGNIRYFYNNDGPLIDRCIYHISDDFYAILLRCKSDFYKNNKVLSSVKIMIYSTNHPSLLTDYFGKEYYNIALTNLSDIFKVEKMFDNKYGKTKNSFSTKKDEWGLEYGKKQWYKDDLVIKLEFVQKAGMIGYYMCWVTYEFNEKIKSQIKSNNGNI